jgi:hypothetical protein
MHVYSSRLPSIGFLNDKGKVIKGINGKYVEVRVWQKSSANCCGNKNLTKRN